MSHLTRVSGLWRARLVVTLALCLVAAGCGNDWGKRVSAGPTDSRPTPTTTGGGTATTGHEAFVPVDAPGVTDTEIRVGGVASVTNPLGGRYGDAFAGVQAYFDMVNAQGGVYGRKLVLAAERDDKLANNKSEVEGLLSQDDVFAVLPIATLLFTGADTLVQQNVPTFGWTINPEWQGTRDDPRLNMFGQSGSFLCFTCAQPTLPWLAQTIGAHKVGILAYSVAQSSDCATGVKNSFEKYGPETKSKVVYIDQSLAYGPSDLSVQVGKMKDKGVDLVTTCMDTDGVVTLAKEMKKQRLKAVQYLPNGYDHDFVKEFGDLFEGSYVRTDFVQWEVDDKPAGLSTFLAQMKKAGVEPTENSMSAWLNADLFVRGLRAAGPDFSRQKVIDAINRMTDYKADGILEGVDWTTAHTQPDSRKRNCAFISKIEDSEFVPVFSKPGKPFVCAVIEPNRLTTDYTS